MPEPLDVELLLQRAAASIDVSGVDRVLAALAPRLGAEAPSSPVVRWRTRRRWLAAAAAVLIAASALVVSPGAREAVARFLGVRGVEILRLDALPPGALVVALPDLDVGAPITLAEAREQLGYQPWTFDRSRFGLPDGVYLDGTALSYVYRPTPDLPETKVAGVGLLLTQFEGQTGYDIVKKVIDDDTAVHAVSVGDRPGLWIEGQHAVAYRDPKTDNFVEVPVRLSGNVLLWQDGDLTLRLEVNLSREEAIAVAETLDR